MNRDKPAVRGASRLVAAAVFFAVAAIARAQEPVWERANGPFAASVTTLRALSADAVLAGTDSGKLFRSDDAGRAWREVPGDFGGRRITAIALNGSSTFVGTDGNGVYESADDLATWKALNRQALPTPAVTALTTYDGSLYVGTTGGVSRIEPTEDGKRVWRTLIAGLRNVHVRDLAVGPSGLIAATNGGVFRFDQATTTWTPTNGGLVARNGRDTAPIRCLFINNSDVFAGSSSSGVFRSSDGGTTWQSASEGLTTQNILAFASDGATLYAGVAGDGVYRSADNGATWTLANDGCSNTYPYAFVAVDESVIVGTFGTGVFRLDRGASSWQPSSAGMSNASVFALADTGGSLLAGTVGGVFRSTDGVNWTLHNEGLRNVNVRAFGRVGERLAVGLYRGGYAVTTDDGRTWTPGDRAVERWTVRAFLRSGTRSFVAVASQGLYASDADAPLKAIETSASFPFVAAIAELDGRLYAASDGRGVQVSLDGGQTWSAANDGLTILSVFDIVSHRGRIYCATFGGGVQALDELGAWIPRNGDLTDLQVRSLVSIGETLYAATASAGVFRSSDSGASWHAVNDGLNDLNVRMILHSKGFLYAATARDGVYRLRLP